MEENAVWAYQEPLEGCVDARDYVSFYWNRMDGWFEEEEEVFIGPKDPYTRVDCLQSSRHVRVELNGVTVAETDQPVMLLETGLPHRYYIPGKDVRKDLLRPSERVLGSTYKGMASYFHAEVGGETFEDVAWTYRDPTTESAKVAGYVCFPQGKADVYVDGELEQKPNTRWD